MMSERLAEIRELLVTYRLPGNPDQQDELLRATQDLYNLARQGLRREAEMRDLVVKLAAMLEIHR